MQDNLYLLELFHGPTFAFKDVALQFLGNLFEYFLTRRNQGKIGRGESTMQTCGIRQCTKTVPGAYTIIQTGIT